MYNEYIKKYCYKFSGEPLECNEKEGTIHGVCFKPKNDFYHI